MKRRPVIAICGALLWFSILHSVKAEGGRGKELFEKRCAGCHAMDRDRTGPRLRGVFGRSAASGPSFPYSEALRKSRVTWDSASLDKWLADADQFIPGNDMSFRVINPDERASLIEYLRETR